MWKKPEINKPSFDNIAMEEMTEKEQAKVNGESVGVCYVAGYSCWRRGN